MWKCGKNGSVEVWQCGKYQAVWQVSGSVEVWQCGSLAVWKNDSVEVL